MTLMAIHIKLPAFRTVLAKTFSWNWFLKSLRYDTFGLERTFSALPSGLVYKQYAIVTHPSSKAGTKTSDLTPLIWYIVKEFMHVHCVYFWNFANFSPVLEINNIRWTALHIAGSWTYIVWDICLSKCQLCQLNLVYSFFLRPRKHDIKFCDGVDSLWRAKLNIDILVYP